MKVKNNMDRFIFNIIGYLVFFILAVASLLPILLIVAGSFTEESAIYLNGYSLIPAKLSLDAYRLTFKAPELIFNAFSVSVFVTVAGTVFGLFLTSMTAYVLQRKDFKFRNIFSFYFYFTTLFSGGLVPWYIMMINYFHMKNNFLALILPPMINVFNLLIMKSFFASIPIEITEAAIIDGANDFNIFTMVILPISKPVMATIGMYLALTYWNDWYNAMLFISNSKMVSLQYYLYNIINKMESLNTMAAATGIPVPDMPKESFKLAVTVITVLPITVVFPFVQKYFVSGMTIGAVKG